MTAPLYTRAIASQGVGTVASDTMKVQGGTVLELIAQCTDIGASGTVAYAVEVRWGSTGPWLGIYSSTMIASDYRAVTLGPNAPSAKPLGYEVRVTTTVAVNAVVHGYAVHIR